MFDMGFIRDLRRILRRCPPYHKRQTMLFSATLSLRVMELAYEHTNNAEKIEIEPERVRAHGIREVLYHVSSGEKFRLLLGLLEREGGRRVLIFVNRRTTAAELVRGLSANGYPTRALAGRRAAGAPAPDPERLQGRQARRARRDRRRLARPPHRGRCPTSSTTTCPQDAEDYVHRIGRTGRAGARRHRRLLRVRRLRLLARRDREARSAARSRSSGPPRTCSARAPSPRRRGRRALAAPGAPRPRRAPLAASGEDVFGRTKRKSRRR